MRTVFVFFLFLSLQGSLAVAQDEIYRTEDGEYVIVRTEERSSNRGWIRLGGLLLFLALGGGVAVATKRTYRRPKNRTRPGSGSTGTGIRKPVRPTFNKPKNRT